jgi:hypothetical protein
MLRMVRPKLEPRAVAPLAATAGMAVVVLLLRTQNLAISIGFGVLAYSVLLLLLRGLTPQDLGLVKEP